MATKIGASRRRILLAGSVTAVLFLVGALLNNAARSTATNDTSGAKADTDGTTSSPDGSTPPAGKIDRKLERKPAGYSHDEDGAVAAALAYSSASQGWLYLTDQEIRDEVTRIATPGAGARLADEVVAEVYRAREQLGTSSGPVWWLVHPLAWDLESYAGDQARVQVWIMTVLSAAEVAAPQTEWMTVTIDLAWTDGDWHVDAIRDTPGPTPMSGPNDLPWDAAPFAEALNEFTRIDRARAT